MIVAWHEVPGKVCTTNRPVGYGVIGWLVRVRIRARCFITHPRKGVNTTESPSYRTLRDGTLSHWFQALRARLISSSPCGTKIATLGSTIMGRTRVCRLTHIVRPLTYHTVPYGTGLSMSRFQAFHTWLPSFGP